MQPKRTDPTRLLLAVLVLGLEIAILASMTSCGAGRRSSLVGEPGPGAPPGTRSDLYVEEGVASWYGHPFHGRLTASGEVYDMHDLTAAHKTLPLGVTARVTRLDNGRSVTVKINDRGPFVKNRIIDLSYKAAGKIGMVEEGVTPVRIEVEGLRDYVPGPFSVQVGSFRDRNNAREMEERLARRYPDVEVVEDEGLFKVRVGSFETEGEARDLAQRLEGEGITGFVTQ